MDVNRLASYLSSVCGETMAYKGIWQRKAWVTSELLTPVLLKPFFLVLYQNSDNNNASLSEFHVYKVQISPHSVWIIRVLTSPVESGITFSIVIILSVLSSLHIL